VVSHYKRLSSDIIILQTEWLLDAMYEALRLTENPLKIKSGKLSDENFDSIWQAYAKEEKELFKAYMLESDLLSEPKADFETDKLERNYKYLMPALFPICPSHLRFEWEDKKVYWVIKFRFMYPDIMKRLQVKILNFCHYQEEESLFKNYLAFTGKKDERCHIEAFNEEKEIRIWANKESFYIEMINLLDKIYPLERLQVFERTKNQTDRRIEFIKTENNKYQLENKPEMKVTAKKPEKVFVTYCWTDANGRFDKDHQDKIHSLVNALRKRGFDATFDLALNDASTANDFMRMMVENLHRNDKVIVVLSEGYALKANDFKGGVGDEYQLIIKDIKAQANKYILVTLSGRSDKIYPFGLAGRDTIDLSKNDETEIENLLRKLKGGHSIILEPIGSVIELPEPKKGDVLF
jgi:hypothetical protein